LAHDRLFGSRGPESKRVIRRIRQVASEEHADGIALLDVEWFQRRLWTIEVDHAALQQSIIRFVQAASEGGTLGAETSMLKARGNAVHQAAHDLLVDAVGYYGLPFEGDIAAYSAEHAYYGPDYAQALSSGRYFARGVSLAGGTQEIQSVVAAKQALGL
jgi:alkylation response protein AidB-like acyl-CoA dehydrogenase